MIRFRWKITNAYILHVVTSRQVKLWFSHMTSSPLIISLTCLVRHWSNAMHTTKTTTAWASSSRILTHFASQVFENTMAYYEMLCWHMIEWAKEFPRSHWAQSYRVTYRHTPKAMVTAISVCAHYCTPFELVMWCDARVWCLSGSMCIRYRAMDDENVTATTVFADDENILHSMIDRKKLIRTAVTTDSNT